MTHPTCACGGHPGCELDSAAERPEALGAAGGGAAATSVLTRRAVSRRGVLAGSAAVVAGMALAGCSSTPDSDTGTAPTPTPTPAETDAAEPTAGETGDSPGERLAATSDVAVGGGVVLAASSERVVILTHPAADQFEAFDARCPHAGCRMFQVASNTITCNCHKSTFDAATGDRLGGPAPTGLTPVNITVEGDAVYLT